jgi:hypothetical protein
VSVCLLLGLVLVQTVKYGGNCHSGVFGVLPHACSAQGSHVCHAVLCCCRSDGSYSGNAGSGGSGGSGGPPPPGADMDISAAELVNRLSFHVSCGYRVLSLLSRPIITACGVVGRQQAGNPTSAR